MKTSVLILSFIIASRFFSLFIVLPVISLYAHALEGASAYTTGLIVGIYAIFQMLFSLPFGALSDIIGRRSAMWLGLLVFIIGSFICASASEISTMLIGRSLQGMGAIGGVATAMIADLTSEAERGKAMAIMGASIGLSFAAAMIAGPALAHFAGLASLFYLSAALSVLASALLLLLKAPSKTSFRSSFKAAEFSRILQDKNLLLLYITNFLQKAMISGVFTMLPIAYVHSYGGAQGDLYKLYAAAMVLGFFAMGAGGVVGESRGKSKLILLAGVALFAAAFSSFYIGKLLAFYAGVALFFTALCLHEPIMQSSISKICPQALKGSVLGISNACGYLGSFLAPLCVAFAMHEGYLTTLLLGAFIVCVLWFLALLALENPNDFKVIHIGWSDLSTRLPAVDRGCDDRGYWVKINIRRHPPMQLLESIGLQPSGASVQNFLKEHK